MQDISLDPAICGVTILALLCAAALAAIVPAHQVTRLAPRTLVNGLSASSESRVLGRLRSIAIGIQLAAVCGLLVVAAFFIASVQRKIDASLGFNRANVGVVALDGWSGTSALLAGRLTSTPGVNAVALVSGAPPLVRLTYGGYRLRSTVQRLTADRAAETSVDVYGVSPNYLRTIQAPLLRGRDLSDGDVDQPVVAIDDSVANSLFLKSENPIGKQISVASDSSLKVTIVSVVNSIRSDGPEAPVSASIYLPTLGTPSHVVFRATSLSGSLVQSVQRAIAAATPEGSQAPRLFTLDDAFRRLTMAPRAAAQLLSLAGCVVLLLGSSTIYSAIAWSVTKRRRTIAIRMALGATKATILSMLVVQAGRLLLAGLLLGLPLGYAVTRFAAALVPGISPSDPEVYVAAIAVVLSASLLAIAAPVSQALRTPVVDLLTKPDY